MKTEAEINRMLEVMRHEKTLGRDSEWKKQQYGHHVSALLWVLDMDTKANPLRKKERP